MWSLGPYLAEVNQWAANGEKGPMPQLVQPPPFHWPSIHISDTDLIEFYLFLIVLNTSMIVISLNRRREQN